MIINKMSNKTAAAIFTAIDNCNLDLIKFLLDSPDINSFNDKFYTPLMYAGYYGKVDMFQELLKSKIINLNSRSKLNESALIIVLNAMNSFSTFDKKKYFFMIQLLVSAGADVNIVDAEGNSVLSIAAIHNNCDVVELLLNRGKNILLDKNALKNACYYGNIEVVRLLIRAGVDVDVEFKTSYFISASTHDKIVEMISVAKFKQNKMVGNECCVCFTHIDDMYALVPCGHTTLCKKCIDVLSYCPCCRVRIEKIMKIYK